MSVTMEDEECVKLQVTFHFKQIHGLVQQLQTKSVRDALTYHRKKIMSLHSRKKEYIEERRRVRDAMEHVVEATCRAIMEIDDIRNELSSDDVQGRACLSPENQDQLPLDGVEHHVPIPR
ncbi:hypothetical protein G6011_00728 [Alternaria panax]|uniref:Uncharacterized protein n=1 Tax=Alternaria panax TaxID=48097 RepID=A0AAD4NV00_9PLEO|nr:hypothetical protein G6011_00728 [Alternaria panax]